jgi:hypothetical protein
VPVHRVFLRLLHASQQTEMQHGPHLATAAHMVKSALDRAQTSVQAP